jgi:hypothetical protein
LKTIKTERTFPLPPGADADIVAETVRAIIASAVSTERVVLETSPSLAIRAVIHVPAAPEQSTDAENLWDVLMGNIRLEELGTTALDASMHPLLVLCAAVQLVCSRYRVPVGIITKSREKLFAYFEVQETARLLGLPVLVVGQMEEDTVVVISSSSESMGPLRADHGVVFHIGGQDGE